MSRQFAGMGSISWRVPSCRIVQPYYRHIQVAFVSIVEWTDGIRGAIGLQPQRVDFAVLVTRGNCRVARQQIDLGRHRVAPATRVARLRTQGDGVTVRVGGKNSRTAGEWRSSGIGIDAIFDLQILDAFYQRTVSYTHLTLPTIYS